MDNTTKKREFLKASKWSATLTFLGFLLVIAAIGYSSFELSQVEKRKEELLKEISMKKEKLNSIQKQLDNTKKELHNTDKELSYSFNQLAFVSAQLGQKEVDLASDLAEKALKDSKYSANNARIFIHIQNEIQREKAERIKKALESKGNIVASNIKTVEVSLSRSQLRFFRQREKSEADSIANYLDTLSSEGLDVRLNDLSAYYENSTKIPDRYYELWLKK